MKKIGRNDPCPCGSGKKFKKCCERKMIGRRYMATKIDETAPNLSKSSGLTNLFKNSVSTAKPVQTDRKLTASTPGKTQTPPPSANPPQKATEEKKAAEKSESTEEKIEEEKKSEPKKKTSAKKTKKEQS